MGSQQKRAHDELDELLLARTLGRFTEDQRLRLEELVRENADARRRYVAYMQVEAQLHWRYSRTAEQVPAPSTVQKRPPRRRMSRRLHWLAVTAACVAAVLLAWIWWPRDSREDRQSPGPTQGIVERPVVESGEVGSRYGATVRLAGWQILPRKDSTYEITGDGRLMLAKGEVYVAPDPERTADPGFQIKTPAGFVQARGTRYFVSSEPIQDPPETDREEADMRSVPSASHLTRVYVLTGVVMLGNTLGEVQADAGENAQATNRSAPAKLKDEGNYKEALEVYRKLVADPAHGGQDAAEDVLATQECLKRLNLEAQWDDLADRIAAAHATDWRVLRALAQGYQRARHGGSIIDNRFIRAESGGRGVNTYHRDRLRSMQLMSQALRHTGQEKDKPALFDFFKEFAGYFPTGGDAWRLQYLTDLGTLPDYDVPAYHDQTGGAPVAENGRPVLHRLPESWQQAETDGQRWRWLLRQMAEADPKRADEARLIFADFLRGQFGVQTMGYAPRLDPEGEIEAGPFAVHTLGDNETIARLATGVKRFAMPEEFNFIRIYNEIANNARKPSPSPLRNVTYKVYRGDWDELPEFDKLQPTAAGSVPSNRFDVGIVEPHETYGMVFRGTLEVPADGEYTISLDSDDGAILRIGDDFELAYDGVHGTGYPRVKNVKLSEGQHAVQLEFFEKYGKEDVIISWSGPGVEKQYWTTSREMSPPESARDRLADLYQDRLQLDKAAGQLRKAFEQFGPGKRVARRHKLHQIVDNWGRFEPAGTFAHDQDAKLDYVYRNGKKVKLTASRIKVELLLADIKAYLKTNPKELDGLKYDPNRIGERLVYQNQTRYLQEKPAAEWSVELEPRPMHWDRRTDVQVPVEQPGAYLVQAKMVDGNTSRIIVWVTDTTIVAKPLHKRMLYLVTDASTGQPVPEANAEFFGFWREEIPKDKRVEKDRSHNVHTRNFAASTSNEGIITPEPAEQDHHYQWLVVVRDEKAKRLGVLGFNGVWHADYQEANYQESKAYVFADRPVYRPGQKVHFKAWIRAARYDMAYVSHFAGRKFRVEIHDPHGQKLYDKTLTANEYAAVTDTIALDDNAALGQYRIKVSQRPYIDPFTQERDKDRGLGGTHFRVEEYKKPEFEVTVEAPGEPVKLGEKFEATVKAKYYFGAPVTNGMVHYTVRRSEWTDSWIPSRPWDWFYGRGYWWFGYECLWYPGWEDWGWTIRFGRGHNPPEVVAENSVPIGKDGTVKIAIDSTVAKELFGHMDHQYTITAEVTDESRRTIVGSGSVVAARQPFKVCAWMDGGHYRVGDTMTAHFRARRPDGEPVTGKGAVTLYGVTFDESGKPSEKALQSWQVETDASGAITQEMKATEAGQFRVACELTSAKGHVRSGATLVVVTGEDKLEGDFRFNDLELVLDRAEYDPGDRARLLINTNHPGGAVFLFVRPADGVYRMPEVIRLEGTSAVRSIDVSQADMPNFFVEALTVADGHVHTQTRRIVVPPVKRVLNVAVEPSDDRYEPDEKAKVKVRLTDLSGKPFVGETVLSVYDKSIEYIAGGHPAGDIRAFFWKWQRHHGVHHYHNLDRGFGQLLKEGEIGMEDIGVFGNIGAIRERSWLAGGALRRYWTEYRAESAGTGSWYSREGRDLSAGGLAVYNDAAPVEVALLVPPSVAGARAGEELDFDRKGLAARYEGEAEPVAVRKDFADSAYWTGAVVTDKDGVAQIEVPMPENLTTWKIHAWSLGHGTVVGQGTAEVITAKDLLIRLQAPRFFVENDEVTLSANVHNYLEGERNIQVRLNLDGGVLALADGQQPRHSLTIPAGEDRRVDWRVRVVGTGEAVVRVSAVTGKSSDAMEMKFPAYVHGMLKTDSYSAAVRPDGESTKVTVTVPKKRRPEQTHLEVRYSPSIALAMVDALPYLAGYEYKHSEAALSRFVPLAITRRILVEMGVDLEAVKEKLTNLNPQEIGEAGKRAAQWKKGRTNPVFDNEQVDGLIRRGLRDLAFLHNDDGGWGWAPGSKSDAHSTAYVVHGLQTAKAHGMALVPDLLENGVKWLEEYQKAEVEKIANWETRKKRPWKPHADNLDAFVAMVLADAEEPNQQMLDYLYGDRTELSVYALAMLGLTFDTLENAERRDMCLRNVKQYLVVDKENQTAYLNLPNRRYWWCWYGSGIEAHAYFLKLLARVEPQSAVASGVAKYLLNNRKHATWWSCTRDTALSIEALADFITASGESKPDMTVELLVDGAKHKEIRITADNLFTFDNVLHLRGGALAAGKHAIELRRTGKGPVYLNAYLTNFTLEDFINKAGLEIKVQRRYYKLVRKDQDIKATGSRGQALDYRVEHYDRMPLKSGARLASGDLVEVELILTSKNDYEHLLFEDYKPAGLEPVDLQSGWVRNAYMELRDEKVAFLVRRLPRSTQTITYRLRAEIPGRFSALPTKGLGVYAPELRANSDEIKLNVVDR